MIDLYCERVGAGFWAEPLNAATNLAFLVAAWATGWLIWRSAHGSAILWCLPALMACIGLGSGLFHTLSTAWARVLDVLPILLFQLVYLWLHARGIMAHGRSGSAAIVVAFLAAALLSRQFPVVLNGSLMYVPAAIVMLGLGVEHRVAGRREPWGLILAGVLFLIAVGFRSVDQAFCPTLPIGTHFLWHVMTAVVLYLTSRVLLLNWPAVGPSCVRLGSLETHAAAGSGHAR